MVGISAVISCYNSSRYIPSCVQGLRSQAPVINEIIVVDDHSADDTSSVAQDLGCDVVRHDQVLGLSSTRNTGLVHATHDLVVFVDADVQLCEGWLQAVLDVFNEPGVVLAGGRLIERHQEQPCDRWRARHMGQDHGMLAMSFRKGNKGRLSGFATLARRNVLLAAGGYDTKFGRSYEDVDLSHRLIDAGHVLAYAPAAVALHGRTDRMRSLMGSCWSWDHWPNFNAGIYHSGWRTAFKLLDNVRRGIRLATIDVKESDAQRALISFGMIGYHSWWDARYYLSNCSWLPARFKHPDADMGNLGRTPPHANIILGSSG